MAWQGTSQQRNTTQILISLFFVVSFGSYGVLLWVLPLVCWCIGLLCESIGVVGASVSQGFCRMGPLALLQKLNETCWIKKTIKQKIIKNNGRYFLRRGGWWNLPHCLWQGDLHTASVPKKRKAETAANLLIESDLMKKELKRQNNAQLRKRVEAQRDDLLLPDGQVHDKEVMKAVKQHQASDASLLKKGQRYERLAIHGIGTLTCDLIQPISGRTYSVDACRVRLSAWPLSKEALCSRCERCDNRSSPGRDFSRAGIGTFAEGNAHGCCSWG